MLFILLSSSCHLIAENGRLLGAIPVGGAPMFLVGRGNTLEMQRLDGTILKRISDCVVVDVADASRWITIESTADTTTLNVRNGMDIAESVRLNDPVPLIGLMQDCSRIPITAGPLVLIPEWTPLLWNRNSGVKRPIPGLFREEEGALILEDFSYLQVVSEMVFLQSGDRLEAMNLNSLEKLGSVKAERNLLDAIPTDGKILLRMEDGERLVWKKDSKKFKRLDRSEADRDALVFRWEPVAGRLLEVRLALEDMGLFDVLSAWKSGQLQADLVVRTGDRPLLEKRLVFSVKDVGNFVFRIIRRDRAVMIEFREKTEVLHFRDGKPRVISVDDRLNPIVYQDKVYVLENGGIRELKEQ